jgi:AraC-like DNA-binding protein
MVPQTSSLRGNLHIWDAPDRIELIPHFMAEQDVLIQGIFCALREELEFGKIGGYLLIDSLKTTLAIHLLRNYCTTQPKLSSYADGLSKPTRQQVRDYISDHLHQDVKLIDLAALAQMSPYHFLRFYCCVHRISACALSDSHRWYRSKVSALNFSDSVKLLARLNCSGNFIVEQKELSVTALRCTEADVQKAQSRLLSIGLMELVINLRDRLSKIYVR